MLVAVAVDALLDVGLPRFVISDPEFEAIFLDVKPHLGEVLRRGVDPMIEFVHVVVARIVAVQQVNQHVLDADVGGHLDDS